MNLKKMFSWGNDTQDITENMTQKLEIADESSQDKIVHLDTSIHKSNSDSEGQEALPEPTAQSTQYNGLLKSPELVEFFAENHFGHGRHNGSNLRTLEAKQMGRDALISKFQNVVVILIQYKQNKINKLKSQLVAIEGLCSQTSERLTLACENANQEISELGEQLEISAEGKGWILEALNRYQMGFIKGMQEAIEFQLLLG